MTRINAGYRRFLFLMALNQVTPGRYPNTKAGTVACPERSEKCEAGKPGCHKATSWDGLYQAFAVILDGLFLGLPHDTLSLAESWRSQHTKTDGLIRKAAGVTGLPYHAVNVDHLEYFHICSMGLSKYALVIWHSHGTMDHVNRLCLHGGTNNSEHLWHHKNK